jgi:hypothetical protein
MALNLCPTCSKFSCLKLDILLMFQVLNRLTCLFKQFTHCIRVLWLESYQWLFPPPALTVRFLGCEEFVNHSSDDTVSVWVRWSKIFCSWGYIRFAEFPDGYVYRALKAILVLKPPLCFSLLLSSWTWIVASVVDEIHVVLWNWSG